MEKNYNGDSSLIYTLQLLKDKKRAYNISINDKIKEIKLYLIKPKYNRLDFKEDAAQKIRDYFNSNHR